MRLPGRMSAAIEVLEDVLTNHRPAAVALKDWARGHRFAGSGDRAAIGNIVYDVLRHKASAAHRMGSETPRALVLATLVDQWAVPVDEIAEHCTAEHGPGDMSVQEKGALTDKPAAMEDWIAGNYPQWLHDDLASVFGAGVRAQGQALAARAPVDLRVNTLKSTKQKVLKTLSKFSAAETPLSPAGVRLAVPEAGGRNPNVEADPAHGKGWFEVQDAGSQIAALMSGAKPGMQVADICAGAGGKTLALAAMMENRGQLFAHDADKYRLRPIFERVKRAGVRNVQIIGADETERLAQLDGHMDVVLVDAPCSGSGAWRRRPDAKWRFNGKLLAERLDEQRAVLERTALLVKPGGRLVYVTCSLLRQENNDQADKFLAKNTDFSIVPFADVWRTAIGTQPPQSADGRTDTLLLSPANHGTDGFFIAVMQRG